MSDTHPKAGDKINVNIGGLSRPATVVDKPAYVELEGRVWFKYDDGTHGTWHIPVESLTLDLYADYPGGADQYREDVATLTEAGALGDKATRGEWRWNFRHGTRYGDVITALESEASDGECFDIIELGGLPHMMIFSNADADLLVNAVNVARALSRYMPWMGGAS